MPSTASSSPASTSPTPNFYGFGDAIPLKSASASVRISRSRRAISIDDPAEPRTYKQAMASFAAHQWKATMGEEIASMHIKMSVGRMHVCILVLTSWYHMYKIPGEEESTRGESTRGGGA